MSGTPRIELSLQEARARVLQAANGCRRASQEATDQPADSIDSSGVSETWAPGTERVSFTSSLGRVLAQAVGADRPYPPFHRAMRDGYAVRSSDTRIGAKLRRTGIVRAGERSADQVLPGTCQEIMTGAPVPEGADAVIMIEHCDERGEMVSLERAVKAGENIAEAGCEAAAGDVVLPAGLRIDDAVLAVLSTVGQVEVQVYRRPRVAIVATGDELVEPGNASPRPEQIRNSNSAAIAALVQRYGGEPLVYPITPDEPALLRNRIQQALSEADLLVFSGGVSMGKYDLVEPALEELGAEFIFDAVRIRPGKPAVFGRLQGRFFFGLPGNPLSCALTFRLFAASMLQVMAGLDPAQAESPFLSAELAFDYAGKPVGLHLFLPVRLRGDLTAARVEQISYQGSADVSALARADGYLVLPPGTGNLPAGSTVAFLPK